MGNSLKRLGVDIIQGWGKIAAPQKVTVDTPEGEKNITANHIILAPGSIPFVPPGIEIDGKTVFTSDDALKLETLPPWVAIIGSGYIGLEFADVYSALGCEITTIEALDTLMPTFDPDIAKIAKRVLLDSRDIEAHAGVLAQKVTPRPSGDHRTGGYENPRSSRCVGSGCLFGGHRTHSLYRELEFSGSGGGNRFAEALSP